jgi:tripartite-type tricarboxylate transporter receptor subunit TctC
VAKSNPDGHTLLLTPNTMVISPHVLAPGAGGGVDVQKDLAPVIAPATTPLVLVAHPSLGATNLKAAMDAARKTPGLPFGSAGNGWLASFGLGCHKACQPDCAPPSPFCAKAVMR